MAEDIILGHRVEMHTDAYRMLFDVSIVINRCASEWHDVDAMRAELANAGKYGKHLLEQAIAEKQRAILLRAANAGRAIERATQAVGYKGVS